MLAARLPLRIAARRNWPLSSLKSTAIKDIFLSFRGNGREWGSSPTWASRVGLV